MERLRPRVVLWCANRMSEKLRSKTHPEDMAQERGGAARERRQRIADALAELKRDPERMAQLDRPIFLHPARGSNFTITSPRTNRSSKSGTCKTRLVRSFHLANCRV